MHGYIYEINDERIAKEKWINELTFCDDPNIDYARDLDKEERVAAIKRLHENSLFSQLFEWTDRVDEVILKAGAVDDIKQDWYHTMDADINYMRGENSADVSRLRRTMDNPPYGEGAERWCLPNWCGEISEPGRELLWFASTKKPGTKFYIGGVLDYHW